MHRRKKAEKLLTILAPHGIFTVAAAMVMGVHSEPAHGADKEQTMKKIINRVRSLFHGHREAGRATAEYAIGTVAVVSLGGVLVKLFSDPAFRELIWKFLQWLFQLIMGMMGV